MRQMSELDKPTEKTPNPWPIGGYAPGNYACTCGGCDRLFSGDKRSWQCLECAIAHRTSVYEMELKSAMGLLGESVLKVVELEKENLRLKEELLAAARRLLSQER